jgi:endo-1,4-beta-mannosidase
MPAALRRVSVLSICLLSLPISTSCADERDVDQVRVPRFEACRATDLGGALVEVEADRFVANGVAFVPHGINSYPLLQHVGDERWDHVRDIFRQALALRRPFIRTNAFMDGGDNPARLRDEQGQLREEGLVALDALLAEARSFDLRLLLVLTNNWSDYGGAPAVVRAISPAQELPKDAFWSDPRALAAQASFIRALVGRTNTITGSAYARDETVFAWELANEARCTMPEYCTRSTLVDWARAMSAEIRAQQARQPIAWGGSGGLGEEGEDLEALARDGAVDILTVHRYAKATSSRLSRQARISDAIESSARALHERSALAERHGMPLLVEELGYRPPDDAEDRDAERSEVLRSLLAIVHEAGLAALPWMIGERGRPDYDGHLITPNDTRSVELLTCVE